jgi:hypothetical protein
VELGFFLALELPIHREANTNIGDRFAILGMPQLGVAGGAADEDDFIDSSHPSIIASACKN